MKRAYLTCLTSALGAAALRLNVSMATMTVLFISIGTTVAFGQVSSYGDLSYRCNVINVNERTSALGSAQWSRLIQLAIAYKDNCQDFSTREQKAIAYLDIGIGANSQGSYLYAIEVLKGCVRLLPTYAPCHLEDGRAKAALGKVQEARESLKKAITSGGYDEMSIAAVQTAKVLLDELGPPPSSTPRPSDPVTVPSQQTYYGSGFFVSDAGHILTNNHVVEGCTNLTLRDGSHLQLVDRSVSSDLALLRTDSKPPAVAVFRAGVPPKLGEGVVAFGYPLRDILSSSGNVSVGVLSAMAGVQDDVKMVQISAPVQPGNSGGPLLDGSGHVIGVVVAKLDTLDMARLTGDVPQNVNFAVHWAEVRAFLEQQAIKYRAQPSIRPVATSDTAERAARFSVAITCVR